MRAEPRITLFLEQRVNGVEAEGGRVRAYGIDPRQWSRETEGYFQAITEHSLVAVSIVRDGRFVYANRKVLDILGYGAEELLGMADLLAEGNKCLDVYPRKA